MPVDEKTYVIGAQDILAIAVWGEQAFNNQYLVRPDGKITIPFIGEVMAAGRTPVDVGTEISKRLEKLIKEPLTSVMLAAIHSKKFYIQGEVLKPGEFDLIVPTRVLEALVQAGGFRDFANQKNIIINRGNGGKILKFNYKDVIQGKHPEQNIYLEPGDVIVVK